MLLLFPWSHFFHLHLWHLCSSSVCAAGSSFHANCKTFNFRSDPKKRLTDRQLLSCSSTRQRRLIRAIKNKSMNPSTPRLHLPWVHHLFWGIWLWFKDVKIVSNLGPWPENEASGLSDLNLPHLFSVSSLKWVTPSTGWPNNSVH